MAGHVAGAAGIGVASYAYGQHQALKETTDSNVTGVANTVEKTQSDQEEGQGWDVVTQVEENENSNISGEDIVVEPEPIVHTDGIDFVIQVDDAGQAGEAVFKDESIIVAETEQIVVDLPEPVLRDSELIADNGMDATDNETGGGTIEDIVSNEITDDFIGNDIQKDLLG